MVFACVSFSYNSTNCVGHPVFLCKLCNSTMKVTMVWLLHLYGSQFPLLHFQMMSCGCVTTFTSPLLHSLVGGVRACLCGGRGWLCLENSIVLFLVYGYQICC